MNTIGSCNMKKLKPVIIYNRQDFYVGMVDDNDENSFYNFMGPYYNLVEEEPRISTDCIYDMTPTLYFEISCAFKNKGLTYNLKKHKHISNDRKGYTY